MRLLHRFRTSSWLQLSRFNPWLWIGLQCGRVDHGANKIPSPVLVIAPGTGGPQTSLPMSITGWSLYLHSIPVIGTDISNLHCRSIVGTSTVWSPGRSTPSDPILSFLLSSILYIMSTIILSGTSPCTSYLQHATSSSASPENCKATVMIRFRNCHIVGKYLLAELLIADLLRS